MTGRETAIRILQDTLTLPGAKYLAELVQLSLDNPKTDKWARELFNFMATGKGYKRGMIENQNLTFYDAYKAAKDNRGVQRLVWSIEGAPKEVQAVIVHKLIEELAKRSDIQQIIRGLKLLVATDNLWTMKDRGKKFREVYPSHLYGYLLTGDVQQLGLDLRNVIADLIMDPDKQINDIISKISDDAVINELIKMAWSDLPRGIENVSKEEKLKVLVDVLPKHYNFQPYLSELNPLFESLFAIPPAPEVPTIK